ncbi:NAD(P)-dependent malic enzyme [Schnuerera ultunensis]|uniref:NADP-dependent malic enzyme (Conversion of malate into pyruvate) n=1 Tax=[Clostridium] ultunense Esp TaxID=1288971 RepID=A0A1M4PPX5_9FIRM|nr:malic enzyme-like NAD(P)-binding protein [Schnuerera ultunensis]SHD77534.1 NADP-dependent malic enzyme (conversion of malate into pyruvate) [[Clostridium] ultunense Esp]
MNYPELSLKLHQDNQGKIEVVSKVKVETKDDLSTAYTPGVAEPCRQIHKNKENVYKYTAKGNLVAVVTDGSAVLGLGDIGPEAAMPVMEGKSILFKEFANVDAFPICLATNDVDQIVETVKRISPSFGGINLEDISAPKCVEIERKLKEELDIPVFHDDQHGTAVVVAAGLINALKIVGKKFEEVRVVINGAGAAGTAVVKILLTLGVKDMILCDSKGIVYKGNPENNWLKEEIAQLINKENRKGTLRDAMVGADVFIGVSVGELVDADMIKSMNKDAIVFAMANPIPEIFPDEAKKAGARVVGSGRSDFANQINNVVAFPGIFRGALDARAKDINDEMNIAAAYAIANMVKEAELNEDYIIPSALDKNIAYEVAKAVEKAARESGVARI